MDELRWLGSELGAARDAEVLLERLRGRVATLSAEDARNAQPILDAHAAQEHEGRERLLAAMREPRYYALLDALVESIPHPLFADAGRSKALRVMPRLMRRAWKSVRKLVRKVDGTPTNRELHDIRIKAKRARYAAEMFAQIAPARRFATRMESLQLELGEHHDAVVVQQRLRHFRHDPSLAFAAGLITAKESAIAERVRRKWRSTLRKAEREGCTFWE